MIRQNFPTFTNVHSDIIADIVNNALHFFLVHFVI